MENRLPIELASNYNLYKQKITEVFLNTKNCILYKDGERVNKDVFFEKHRDYFMGVAYNSQIQKDKENAKDAVGDLYIYFKTKFKKCQYNNEGHAKGALSVYLRFILKDSVCMIKNHYEISTFPLQNMPQELEVNDYQTSEPLNIIKKQISTLPRNLKDVITLRYLEGLTIEEIAEKLDITKKVASNRSCKGINLIKNNLGIEIETLQPSMSVIQYTLNGKFIKQYPSMNEARRQTGIGVTSISKCCEDYTSHGGGYKWSYEK